MIIVVDCTNCLDGNEDLLSLPKIPSGLDSGLRKNHRMIQDDACDRAPAGLFVADLVQIADPA
jgi:hypothetical protein